MAERLASTILSADGPEGPSGGAPGTRDRAATIAARFGGRVEPLDNSDDRDSRGSHDDRDDSVVIVWGPSPASSDDTERAVRAGLELVLAGLATRVGLADDDPDQAAAVRASAGPGEVWVTEAVRSRTSAAIRYSDRGRPGRPERPGEPEPSRRHRADAVVDVVGGSGRPERVWSPLVGRRRELAQIKDALHATVEDSAGRLLVVAGPAGAPGTTRLGTELEHYIDGLAGRVWWLWGRSASYGDATSYSALAAVLRGRIAAGDKDDRPTLRAKVERTTAGLAITDEERGWLTERLLALLVGDPRLAPAELFAGWLFWFEHLGRTEPVVWVLDDAHLADDGLVAFVDHVVRRAATPVLVLALGRPEIVTRFAQVGPGERVATIRLDALPAEAMAALAVALRPEVDEPARTRLVDAAQGIPLYLVEQARLRSTPGVGAGADPDGRDLRAVIAARLDRLPEPDARLLDAAAVLGASFGTEVLAAVAGQDEGAVVEALVRLSDRDLVHRVGDPLLADFGQHAFLQPLVREVAYNRIPSAERARLHGRAADVVAARAGARAELALVVASHRAAAAGP